MLLLIHNPSWLHPLSPALRVQPRNGRMKSIAINISFTNYGPSFFIRTGLLSPAESEAGGL